MIFKDEFEITTKKFFDEKFEEYLDKGFEPHSSDINIIKSDVYQFIEALDAQKNMTELNYIDRLFISVDLDNKISLTSRRERK